MVETNTSAQKLRNARACEACRVSKSRCVYKSNVGVCQRCEQSGGQCIVRAKARPMRTRTIRPSGSTNKNIRSVSAASEFSIELPTISSPNTREDIEALHEHHMQLFDNSDDGELKQSHNSPSKHPAIIEQRRVTFDQADNLLSLFRGMAPHFPFVQIPAEATVPSLSRTSPFLLLAVLTTASIGDPPLYRQMNHEFKRILSAKVIIEGRRSLDFLQGLLIYTAWYPLHVNPRNNQSFMYLNLAISLVGDLGIDQEVPIPQGFSNFSTEGLINGASFTDSARRAYLGCYYLSASLSMGFQKPNDLRYRNLMNNYGQVLTQNEHSLEINSLVKLQRLAERVAELHASKEPTGDPQMEALAAEVNIQIFQNELDEWRRSTPDAMRNLPFIGIAERYVACVIYSYELGLLRRPYRDHLRSIATTEPANPAHLEKCLEHLKRFFEYLLSLPEASYLNFTAVQWSATVHEVLAASRLTFIMAASLGWDSVTTRAQIPLVMYLDALCYRFQQLSSTSSDSIEAPMNVDIMYIFKRILGSVKKSYERRVSKIEPGFLVVDQNNVIGVARGHCPILDPTLNPLFDISESTYGGSFDLRDYSATPSVSATSASTQAPLYYDVWATMTGSWAEEF